MKIMRSTYHMTVPWNRSAGVACVIMGENPDKSDLQDVEKFLIGRCLVKTSTPRTLTQEQFNEVFNFIDILVKEKAGTIILHGTHSFLSAELCDVVKEYLISTNSLDKDGCTLYHIEINDEVAKRYRLWLQEFVKAKASK